MDMEIQKAFDDALMVVNAMTAEAVRVKEKYGESSRIFQEKIQQIEVIKKLYRVSAAYINESQDEQEGTDRMIKLQAINNQVLQAVVMQADTGLPWAKVGVVLGDPNPERWEVIDKIDAIAHTLNNLTYTCKVCRQKSKELR